ncbi:MAG: AAA family ATPase [Gammaproteobacteria bacterium]|nr:AAA family ATPase [Gammaproteobacteria bacterium]
MYLDFFGLREYPFSLTPNTHFFMAYGHYRDALNTIRVALDSGEGFIKVVAEVGCGKTLLCRTLLKQLDERFYSAYIPNPEFSPLSLLRALSDELAIQAIDKADHYQLTCALKARLIELNSTANRQVVLCIDEAQAMPQATLEELRLLTNLETEKRKLLQVVLFGQPELDSLLNGHNLRQLKQRITFATRLYPIDQEGLISYINHRLLQAGSNGTVRFTPRALRRIYYGSSGYPRLINILAHKALMVAFGRGDRTINGRDIKLAINDTEAATPLKLWQ